MNCLLDTHILLWATSEQNKLSESHKAIIEDKGNLIFITYFSYIEISIKLKLGKLPDFNSTLSELFSQSEKTGFINLQTNIAHIQQYQHLPLMDDHRDPFDRFIISTAITEKMKILTVDTKFGLYKDLVEIV